MLGTLAALALGGSCIVMLMGVTPRLSRTTPVTPEPRPTPVLVEVTDKELLVDGVSLLTLPLHAEWGRIGLAADAKAGEAYAPLQAAIQRASHNHPGASNRLAVKLNADTTALMMDQIGKSRIGDATMSTPSSSLGPASSLFLLPPGAGRGDPVHVVLDVRVSYCGIHLFLFEDGHWHRIGPGCKMPDDSWDGPAFMLRRPEDYQPLRSCLATLRTRIPAQIEARPRVSYLGRAEAARAIYFVNLLRCGEVTCRESDPRVWGLISMGVGDECVPARDELIPIYMMRLGPALRGCYEAARPRLSERL